MGVIISRLSTNDPPFLGIPKSRGTFTLEFPDLCEPTFARAFPKSSVLLFNHELAETFGATIDHTALRNTLHNLSSVNYGGHQFGHYCTLGDGRAALFTEVKVGGQLYDIQLVGAGRTPFSKLGTDGRATLVSVLREYLVSEAMFYLGIPTTRALAAFKTGDQIVRNGSVQAGVLVRTAESFIRIGTFEYTAQKHPSQLLNLVKYCCKRHQLELNGSQFTTMPDQFVAAVTDRYAKLVAKWMSVGFIHGVMNTDNASIDGITLDYKSCAFQDEYLASKVFSEIDTEGRYVFDNQPSVAKWNIQVLAKSLDQILTVPKELFEKYFDEQYSTYFYGIMSEKLGLRLWTSFQNVRKLVDSFLHIMETYGLDYTRTFRDLADTQIPGPKFEKWDILWRIAREPDTTIRRQKMQRVNPLYIPRNHLVQEAIDNVLDGDCRMFRHFLEVLQKPFEFQDYSEQFLQLPTDATRILRVGPSCVPKPKQEPHNEKR